MAGIFIPGNTISLGSQGSGGGSYSPIGAAFDAVYTQNLYSDFGVSSTAALTHSVTRASTKYVEDTSGLWTSVSANTLARSSKGALIEESRTNGIRNNSSQGAVVGSPGTVPNFVTTGTNASGLAFSISAVSVENGIEYTDYRLSGTALSATEAFIFFESANTVAVQNQVWTESVFISRVAGSDTNITGMLLRMTARDAGSGNLSTFTSASFLGTIAAASLSTARRTHTATLTDATTAFVRPWFSIPHGTGAVDITLRVGWPQLELGAFATSPIRTTSAAVTRAADVITIDPKYASLAQGSVSLAWAESLGAISTERHLWTQYVDANNYIRARITSGNKAEVIIVSGGVTQAQLTSTNNVAANNTYRLAFRYGLNDVAAAFTTALQASVLTDTVATMPTGTHGIGIGQSGAGASYLNDGLVRVTAFPRKLTDAELSALVAA